MSGLAFVSAAEAAHRTAVRDLAPVETVGERFARVSRIAPRLNAPHRREEALPHAAALFEAAQPWGRRIPPVAAE
jgi:hypothetical protein